MGLGRREFIKRSAQAILSATIVGGSKLVMAGDYDLVIKGVQALINKKFVKCDIGISAGKISKIDSSCSISSGREILNASGLYASAGWVDLHVHAIPITHKKIGSSVARLGPATGVSALLDAGTVGAGNYDMLSNFAISRSEIPVFCMLNIKRLGIRVRDFYRLKPGFEDFKLMEKVIGEHPGSIKGIKIRASKEDSVKEDPMYYMRKSREAGDIFKLPVMVHIGPPPPEITELLALMKEGDIITHFLRKSSHCILDRDGKVREEVLDAKARGVSFDLGHGVGSFSFDTAERALDQGFVDFTISSDLYSVSAKLYARTFANVMTKFLAIGMSLEDVLERSSTKPARMIGLEREIKEGSPADITIFRLESGEFTLTDTSGKKRVSKRRIIPEWTIHNGKKFRAGEVDRALFL